MFWWLIGLFVGLALVGLWMSWGQALRFRRSLDRLAARRGGTVTPVPLSFARLVIPVRGGRIILSVTPPDGDPQTKTYIQLDLADPPPVSLTLRSRSLPERDGRILAKIFSGAPSAPLRLDAGLDEQFMGLAPHEHHDRVQQLLEGRVRDLLLEVAPQEVLRVTLTDAPVERDREKHPHERRACPRFRLEIAMGRFVEDTVTLEHMLDLAAAFHEALHVAKAEPLDWSEAG